MRKEVWVGGGDVDVLFLVDGLAWLAQLEPAVGEKFIFIYRP